MTKRIRKHNPEPVNHYSEYRELLREDFEHSCAYCNITETEVGNLSLFHIDHYRPQKNKLFPNFKALEKTYSNLYYSCFDCNKHKSNFWPNPLHKLFKPCDYVIDPCYEDPENHINTTSAEWTHFSDVGFFNIKRLHLKNALKVKCREKRESTKTKRERMVLHRMQSQNRLAEAILSRNQGAIDYFNDAIEFANETVDECNKFLGKKL